jgi:hypothetical protein
MQGGSQLVRSNRKKLDEVKNIRDAIATRRSVSTDQERREITQQAALLGEDGDSMIEEILDRVKEVASQPADVLRRLHK